MKLRVSIIVNFKNEEAFLQQCLESIFLQNYMGPIELILVDNSSVDSSAEVINSFLLKSKNNKIELVWVTLLDPISLYEARNIGFGLVSGDYFCFLDADDWIHPSRIAVCVEELESKNIDILWHDMHISFHTRLPKRAPKINNRCRAGILVSEGDRQFLKGVISANPLVFSSMFVRRSKVSAAKPFNQRYTILGDLKFYIDNVNARRGWLATRLGTVSVRSESASRKSKLLILYEHIIFISDEPKYLVEILLCLVRNLINSFRNF